MSAVWVLADDRPGNVGQCLGVAESLGHPFEIKPIHYTRMGRLPNLLRDVSLLGVSAESRAALLPPWPRLVIAAGRRTAPVARWIKERCGASLVQIMDPGPGGRSDFDLIAIPDHDRRAPSGGNILRITGAPHRVSLAKLAEAREIWCDRFASLPSLRLGLIVGGSTRKLPFTPIMAEALGRTISQLAPGSVLATTSRRTGTAAETALLASLPSPRFVHRWQDGGENPYFGFLALADVLVVTGDSVSMVCEACASPASVYIYAPEGFVSAKHARLHETLYRQGVARPLEGVTRLETWEHAPLNAADDIAKAIRYG